MTKTLAHGWYAVPTMFKKTASFTALMIAKAKTMSEKIVEVKKVLRAGKLPKGHGGSWWWSEFWLRLRFSMIFSIPMQLF